MNIVDVNAATNWDRKRGAYKPIPRPFDTNKKLDAQSVPLLKAKILLKAKYLSDSLNEDEKKQIQENNRKFMRQKD